MLEDPPEDLRAAPKGYPLWDARAKQARWAMHRRNPKRTASRPTTLGL
jgi:hypothetical protein